MKMPWRRRWTIALVGRYSHTRTSLESLYKFRRMSEALEQATKMNQRLEHDANVLSYEVQARSFEPVKRHWSFDVEQR